MQADLVIRSNAVFTGTDDCAKPGAVAIKDNRIVFTGTSEEVSAFSGPQTPTKDYGDAFISPGLHDSHMHVFHSALYSSSLALSYMGKSEQDCVAALSPLAKNRPRGSWLLSQGWREYRWKTPQMPSRHSLDAAYPDQPVAMYSGDAHTLWVNSTALRELGIDRGSVPPEGGSYERDENGELTGIIRETAAMELMPRIIGTFSQDEIYSMYKEFFESLVAQGITSVCDVALMPHPGLDFIYDSIYRLLESRNELPLRIHLFPTLLSDMARFEKMRANFTGDMVQVRGLKQFFDGVSSQHTALLSQPYSNARFPGDCGQPSIPPETMRELVLGAAKKGYPVRIHTIGDQAIHLALDIFEQARKLYGPLPRGRNCLEHLENFQPDDISRLVELDVVAAVQPPHITLDPGGPERDLGAQRIPYMWPFKTLLDKGATLAFGTDSPVVSPNPLHVLYAAITRQDSLTRQPSNGWLPTEKIPAVEALRASTLGSAHAADRAHELGTLEVGKLADLVVFDRNLLNVEPDELLNAEVTATYVGGACVRGS